jgi:hypothetical protein
MLVVYEFEKSSQQTVAPIPYCFHIVLPVRTGLATFRQVRISVNTASFSPPTGSNSNSSSSSNSSRGYFYAYIAAHPQASGPVVDVPWEEWGPYGAHLVRITDQAYIIRRPRACGMRVLGAPLSKKSVVVADYHPGRVARSATATVGASSVSVSMGGGGTFSDCAAAAARVRSRVPIPAPAPAQLPVGVGTFSPESRSATRLATPTRIPRCFPRLVCATKEVPLPPELQKASESPWTMLCEDALLAFEVSSWYYFFGVSCSAEWITFSTFQCTVCPGRLRNQQGVCLYVLMDWARGATWRASTSVYYHYLSIIYHNSTFFSPLSRGIQIHFRN